MTSAKTKYVIGSAATAAVLCYTYLGSPNNYPEKIDPDLEINAPVEYICSPYQISNGTQDYLFEEITIIHQFASNILENIKDIEPEYSKVVDENFWDLI